jgi:hypothetical protein
MLAWRGGEGSMVLGLGVALGVAGVSWASALYACGPNPPEFECSIDPDCDPSEACQEGHCVGVPCGGGDPCPLGARCIDEACVPVPSGECAIDEDCPADRVCDLSVCAPVSAGRCRTNAHSEAGGECRSGRCYSPVTVCASNADCPAGRYCSDGMTCVVVETMCSQRPAAPRTPFAARVQGGSTASGTCAASDGPEQAVLVPAGEGVLCLDTLGQGIDTVLHARSTQCDPSTELACSDDIGGDVGSRISVDATSADVFVFVDTKVPLEPSVITLHATPGACP